MDLEEWDGIIFGESWVEERIGGGGEEEIAERN